MPWNKLITAFILLTVSACGIPPVDTKLVSSVPADQRTFAIAQDAVRACVDLYDWEKVKRRFRRAGFEVVSQRATTRQGRSISRTLVKSPDEAVSVLLLGNSCYVGLINMTPQQSAQLARIWVDAHDAEPNSAFGDGLSDHVSGAWRRYFIEPAQAPRKSPYLHRIVISAYKTWPHGPYDPQRNLAYDIAGAFPNLPGAAVRLHHFVECKPEWYIAAPKNQFYLPCSGPAYKPK